MDEAGEPYPLTHTSTGSQEEPRDIPALPSPEPHDPPAGVGVIAKRSTTPEGSSSLTSPPSSNGASQSPSTLSFTSPESHAAGSSAANTAASSPRPDLTPGPTTILHQYPAEAGHTTPTIPSQELGDLSLQGTKEPDETGSDDFYTDDEEPPTLGGPVSAPPITQPPPISDAEQLSTRSPTSVPAPIPHQSCSAPHEHDDLADFDSTAQAKALQLYEATTPSSTVEGTNRSVSGEMGRETEKVKEDASKATDERIEGRGEGRQVYTEEVLDESEMPLHPTSPPPEPCLPPDLPTSQLGLAGPSSKHPHANADGTVDLDAWMYDLDEQGWDDIHGIKKATFADDEALARAIAMAPEWDDELVAGAPDRDGGIRGGEMTSVGVVRDGERSGRREGVSAAGEDEIDEEMAIAITVAAEYAELERINREQEEFEERLLLEGAHGPARTNAGDEAGIGAAEDFDDNEDLEDDGTFAECGCCFSMYPLDRMTVCHEAHLFCRSCIRLYATTELGSQNCDLKCMHTSGCASPFPESELRRLLPPKLFSFYERLKQQKELKDAELEGLEVCPFCDWGCILEATKEEYSLFLCGNWECVEVSCRLCRKKAHAPQTCGEVEEDTYLGGRLAIEEAMTEALKRSCPSCEIEFIKSDGCNKMTCPTCRTISCYICRRAIQGYGHFHLNDPRNPGSSWVTNQCPLFDIVDDRHEQEVRDAYERALVDYGQGLPDVEIGENLRVEAPTSSQK